MIWIFISNVKRLSKPYGLSYGIAAGHMDLDSSDANHTAFGSSPLLPLLLLSLSQQRYAPKIASSFKDEYDYIVVGAGAAGSVVASRLSEIPCVNVLLLEAGKPPPIMTEVPVVGEHFGDPDFYWDFQTVPQKHVGLGSVNRQLQWPTGKGVGGASLVNGMIYVRGNKKNYDDWARGGAEGWSYSDVRPYFLKLEDNHDADYLRNGHHVVGGPISVQRPRYDPEIRKPLLETAKILGFKVGDANGENQVGYYDIQAFQRNGQRCSAAKAYLVPAENRTNLDIVANAFVKKVLIQNQIAIGVEFDYKDSTHTVKARREVIVSAGTVNSAKLLMLSGIGPRQHLEDLKISVKADLPVGNNLNDHCGVPIPFQLDSRIPRLSEKYQNQTFVQEYIDNRTGLLTSTVAVSVIAYLNEQNNTDPEYPTFQVNFPETRIESLRDRYKLKDEVYEKTFRPYENSSLYLCIGQLLNPRSRGTVRLNSSNPYDFPLIDPNYLDDPRDLKDLVNAVKTCHDIGESDVMRTSVGSRFLAEVPGCSRGDYPCIARTITSALSHSVGTVKMGDPNDPTTVVDPQLRVKGIQGLRVADASIMPIVPSCNTYIPSVMVGERASDIIKNAVDCNTKVQFKQP